MKQFKSIDLFAGIGGIRLGFEGAFGDEIKPVFVSEWDIHAQMTYQENFKDDFEISGDITKIPEGDIPPFDICLAGFPCQAFSIAGARKGFDDDYKGMARGTLFFDVIRICERHKPLVIFCENVKGLMSHDRGRTYGVIKKSFEGIGYTVHEEVLNSRDFGVPQNRERIYIVAFRSDAVDSSGFKFPKPTDKSKTLKNIIEEKPVNAKYYLSDVYLETLRKHKERHEAKGHGFGYEVRSWDGVAGAIVCGGMGRERNLLIDKRQTDLRPETNIKGEINKEGIRKMTPREWARLQGFPDSFKLSVANVHLYKQLGNSVTVPVIAAIAKEVKEVLKTQKSGRNMLQEVGIISPTKPSKPGKVSSSEIFNESITDNFLSIPKMKSSEYVKYCWDKYKSSCNTINQNNSTNGNIFELIIQTELYRQALCPMFIQAQVAFVPNVNFDVLLYSAENFPIGLSLKTSLRERYKQADLEAVALKYVHRRALNYLITLDEKEAKNSKAKLLNGELLGLDDVVFALSHEFDALIERLSKNAYIWPKQVEVVKARQVVEKGKNAND